MKQNKSAEGARNNPFEFKTPQKVEGLPSTPFTIENVNVHYLNRNGHNVGVTDHKKVSQQNPFKGILNVGIDKPGWQIAIVGDMSKQSNLPETIQEEIMKTNISSVLPIKLTREVYSKLTLEELIKLDEKTNYTELPNTNDGSRGVTVSDETWKADKDRFQLVEVNRSYNGNSILRAFDEYCVIIFYSNMTFDSTITVTGSWSATNTTVTRRSKVYLTLPFGNTERVQSYVTDFLGRVDQSGLQDSMPRFKASGHATPSLMGGAAMET